MLDAAAMIHASAAHFHVYTSISTYILDGCQEIEQQPTWPDNNVIHIRKQQLVSIDMDKLELKNM